MMEQSSLRNSHIVEQTQKYVKFDNDGKTQLINKHNIEPGFNYRKVHYTRQDTQDHQGVFKQEKFRDSTFQINTNSLNKLDPNNGRIVLKRVYDLYKQYPKSCRPEFFPNSQNFCRKVKNHVQLPPFVTEIDIFPAKHYRSLFITQNFTQNGLYQIVINQNGRFETDVVDDIIPVYEENMQPIWSMSVNEAWKIILLKFWAKKNGSYEKVKHINAFQFIQRFTNSNWKYFNLNYDGNNFLEYYSDKLDFGKFVLKTKNTQQIHQAGLIPNCAGYQIIDIQENGRDPKNKGGKRKWSLLIRSTLINKWTGSLSVLDRKVNKLYHPQRYSMSLQRDFMVTAQDFLNLFAAAYVSSQRGRQNYFSEYHLMSIPAHNKNAVFLHFQFKKAGFLDFCIKQFSQNRVEAISKRSRMRAPQDQMNDPHSSKYSNVTRFLRCKFILAKVHDQSQILGQNQYNPLKYQAYDIQYSHGYNRGDARFTKVKPGSYILRIKLQQYDQTAKIVVNYASHQILTMRQIQLNEIDRSLLIRQSLASFIPKVSRYSLDQKRGYQDIAYVQKFQELGYGFVGVRIKKKSPYALLIQVNPQLLTEQGFGLKYPFKGIKEIFSVLVKPGESTSIVLKKNKQDYEWPPKGIHIFKQKPKK